MLRLAMVLVAAAALAAPFSAPDTPSPYFATYAVSYRGLSVGLLHFELRSEGEGRFIYESRPEPGFLARIIVGSSAFERSVLRIDAEGVRPLAWTLNDGKPGSAKDGALEFAWEKGRVRGTVEGERIELPTEPGLQDRLSFQVAVLTALLRGREPGTLPMIDHDRIKHYSYTRAGSGRIVTPAGEFEAVLYQSTRPGSLRLSRVWHAPALGFIPVRAEQLREGKVETVMELVKVERSSR